MYELAPYLVAAIAFLGTAYLITRGRRKAASTASHR
jgi:hypothetical protein